MNRLVQFVYVSSASCLLNEGELRAILESSVRHNSEQGITGMLLYSGGAFMQVLEGEEAAVAETMSRIWVDKRHKDIRELLVNRVDEREFSFWSMGFHVLSQEDVVALPGYAPYFQNGFDSDALAGEPGVAMELLRMFATGNSRG